jgi:hypothetical protein
VLHLFCRSVAFVSLTYLVSRLYSPVTEMLASSGKGRARSFKFEFQVRSLLASGCSARSAREHLLQSSRNEARAERTMGKYLQSTGGIYRNEARAEWELEKVCQLLSHNNAAERPFAIVKVSPHLSPLIYKPPRLTLTHVYRHIL